MIDKAILHRLKVAFAMAALDDLYEPPSWSPFNMFLFGQREPIEAPPLPKPTLRQITEALIYHDRSMLKHFKDTP